MKFCPRCSVVENAVLSFLLSFLLSILYLAAVVYLLLVVADVYALDFVRAKTLEDAHGASCRVCVSGARGTGFFFGAKGDDAYIATNYHVVTKNDSARLDFWTNGKMESINGRIDWRAFDRDSPEDFAVIVVSAAELKKINPPWIALGGSDAKPSVGAVIVSSGAPDGRFTQAWKGQVLEYYNGKTAVFSPPPVPGQSGSAVCEYIDGELFVTGILTWLLGEKGRDDSKGGAIPIANLYKALAKRGVDVDYHDPNVSPIPPNATECAESTAVAPCVLEFTQANCPPCVEAERDVELLRALNVPVYVYDVTTERGAEYAKRYKIDRTPTFVLTNERYAPVQTFVGAGKSEEIRTAFESLKSKTIQNDSTPKHEDDGSQPRERLSIPFTPEPSPSPLNLPELAPLQAPVNDFRNRPPVFEYANDVGIFKDSDERWQALKRKREKRRSEESPDDDGEAQKQTRPRLGERLTDGAIDSIAARIENAVNQKIEDMKAAMKEKWEACKFVLLMGFCLILAVALLVAQGIVAAVKWTWKKAVEINAAIQSAKSMEREAGKHE